MFHRSHPTLRKIVFSVTWLVIFIWPAPIIVAPPVIAVKVGAAQTMTIAEARARPVGTEVTIEGTITAPPGAFKSSKADEGFALEDGSGGIYVRVSRKPRSLRVWQRVRVTGKLGDSNEQLLIVPTDERSIEMFGRTGRVTPKATPTGHINEQTESRLVRVAGTITRDVADDPPYGFRLHLNDGTGETVVFVSTSTGINRRGLLRGQLISVTGVGGQYKEHYEVEPRFPADIRPLPRRK